MSSQSTGNKPPIEVDVSPKSKTHFNAGEVGKAIVIIIIFVVASVLMTVALCQNHDRDLENAIAQTEAKRIEFETAIQKIQEREQELDRREQKLATNQAVLERTENELTEKQATLDEEMTAFNIEKDDFYVQYQRIKELSETLSAELKSLYPDETIEWVNLDEPEDENPDFVVENIDLEEDG